jgi:putative ABC transport system permease protein
MQSALAWQLLATISVVRVKAGLMRILLQDFRFGLRVLFKRPVFTWVAIITLAPGVGANTAIFSIVNAVLLRPLPFRDPGQLVKVRFNNPGLGVTDVSASIPEFEDLKTRSGVFEDVCGMVAEA